jgi:hypothetical protein
MGGLTGMQFADSIAMEEEEDDFTAPLRVSPGNIYASNGIKLTKNPDFAQSSTLFGETTPRVPLTNRPRQITLETVFEGPVPGSNGTKNRDASPITTKRIGLDGTISWVTMKKTENDQEKAKKFSGVSEKVITSSGGNKPPLPKSSYLIQVNNKTASQGVTKTYGRDQVPLFLFVDLMEIG